jgi:hypothetical protein
VSLKFGRVVGDACNLELGMGNSPIPGSSLSDESCSELRVVRGSRTEELCLFLDQPLPPTNSLTSFGVPLLSDITAGVSSFSVFGRFLSLDASFLQPFITFCC